MNVHVEVSPAAAFVAPIPLGAQVEADGLIYDVVGRNEINGELLVRFGDSWCWAPPAAFEVVS